MKNLRKSTYRGHFDHGWLKTYHSFSFGQYHDPDFNNFSSLRVINEDWIAAGQGFGMHGHKDMEIITYILEGSLEHKDSMGNGSVLRAGDLQQMSAGSGVKHSEFNPSETEATHLYQIWLLPDSLGHTPRYQQTSLAQTVETDGFKLVASPEGRNNSLAVHQDALIFLASLASGQSAAYSFVSDQRVSNRNGWLQLLKGNITVGELSMAAGDGLALSSEQALEITATSEAEVMFFDLP